MVLLKKMNDSVLERNNFWKENSLNGIMNGQQMFQGLQKKYSGISDDQFAKYLKDIHGYEGNPREVFTFITKFQIDQIDFKSKHMPYYLGKDQQIKNQDFVIRLFYPLTSVDRQKLDDMKNRLDIIC